MKVLQFGKFFSPYKGGIETVTEQISNMFHEADIQVDVICVGGNLDNVSDRFPYQVYRCLPTFSIGNKVISFRYINLIKKLNDRYDCALVHLPNPLAVIAAILFWKKPIIVLWHANPPRRWMRLMTSCFDRIMLKKSTYIVCPTPIHASHSYLSNHIYGKEKIIPLPFDSERLPLPSKSSDIYFKVKSWLANRRLCISIGRLVPYKGFGVLVESAHYFNENLAAVIVGSGPLYEELNEVIRKKGLGDRVMCVGSVSDEELADLLSLASISCLPSVTPAEMYGVVQVESMSFGVPVVSTKIPGSGVSFVNRHNETGLVVEPNNAIELAEALNKLVDDNDLYNRLSVGALRCFEEEHSIAVIKKSYVDMFSEL